MLALGVLLSGVLRAAEAPASLPFQPRSVPGGSTLFTELPPERTGIVTTNRYDDPRMWSSRHREYHVGAIGTGVAIADYDGDGRPDLFIVSKVESGRLFRNLGDWRFEDVTVAAGVEDRSGEWKQGAAFADVNNDGRPDLYVGRFDAPNQLYINQGDGTFKEEAAARGLAVVDACGMACFADYDRDGWLDVYIQTNLKDFILNPEGQRDLLFRNNGDGTFRNVTDAAGILTQPTQGHSATWWDYDEDGWPDLYIANDFAPPDFLYRNNRDGTFTNVADAVLPHTPFSAMGSDIGDVDNDGRIDLYVADMAGTTHERNQRGLADSRARALTTQNEDSVGRVVQLLASALYLNTGMGRCLEAAHLAGLASTDWTWSTRLEDLDNDGRLDLFVTTGMDREQNNLDMIERRLAAISEAERIRITKTSPMLNQENLAFANRGDLRFEEVGRAWGLDHSGVSFGAAFGDLDADGDLDLVFTNYGKGATVLRNDGRQGNSVIVALRGTASNRFGIGATVEVTTESGPQVRPLVLARGYLSTSEPVAHFGLGEAKTIRRLKIVWPSGRVQVFTDLAAGRRYTVTEPAAATAGEPAPAPPATRFTEVATALGLGLVQREEILEGTVAQPLLPRRFNRRGPGLAVGDLDRDGVDEIIVGATVRDGAKALHRDGTAYRSRDLGAAGAAPPVNAGPPLVFDADGDGTNDLLFTAGGAALPAEEPEYEPRLWLNDGRGSFRPAPPDALPALPISVGAAVAADFDRDGRLDLFLGGRVLPGYYPETPASALLLQRASGFADATKAFAPGLHEVGHVTSALASDVDGDGWIDLVVAVEWGGIRFFRNQSGRGLADASAEAGFDTAGSGLWTSLAAADFNHDGRPDYALGNLGLNTVHTATREHPLRLFTGDFAGRGEPQLVMAYDLNGSLVPVASRGELGAKIPHVLKRFPSSNRYAAATLDEILGREVLAKAAVLEAGELRSGVLLSQPAGGHVFQPLPRYAQIAPVQGLAAADFDGDGHPDLLLVDNDYSPIPSHGRFDSGLGWLLRGDGRGGFQPVPAAESGWVVPGNAKALVLVDLDGDARPDAFVSRNDQSTLAFRNTGADGSLRVALRLHGRGGNPDAVGARITLESGGRLLQVAEIQAGGGYASQSTATVFLAVPRDLAAGAKVRVRWPAGSVTETALPPEGGYLQLNE